MEMALIEPRNGVSAPAGGDTSSQHQQQSASSFRGSVAVDGEPVVAVVPVYEQELRVGLSRFASFAFGFTEVNVFASLVGSIGLTLAAGGPAMAMWGWVVASVATIIVGSSMAEICSAYPSAGSVYHWTAQLASVERAPLWSFITGWLNFLGNAAGDASFAYAFAEMLNAALIAQGSDELSVSTNVAVSIAALIAWSLLNGLGIERLGWLTNLAAGLQITSLVVIGIVVMAMTPRLNSISFLFGETYNDTGFGAFYAVCVGMSAVTFVFTGYEASGHMAEETFDPEVAAPRGLLWTCIATAIGGFVFIVPMLLAMPAVAVAVGEDGVSTGTAAVQIYIYACGRSVAAIVAWLAVVNLFFAGMSSVSVTARITFALIRDNAFPMSAALSGVWERTKAPVKAIALCAIFDVLILLLPLLGAENGTVVLSAILGLTVVGFQISYAIPIFLRFTEGKHTFVPNKFALGRASIPFAITSTAWLVITSICLLLPTKRPVTGQNMNYAGVVLAIVGIVAAAYWNIAGWRQFTGPRRQVVIGSAADPSLPPETTTTTNGGHRSSLYHEEAEAGLALKPASTQSAMPTTPVVDYGAA